MTNLNGVQNHSWGRPGGIQRDTPAGRPIYNLELRPPPGRGYSVHKRGASHQRTYRPNQQFEHTKPKGCLPPAIGPAEDRMLAKPSQTKMLSSAGDRASG